MNLCSLPAEQLSADETTPVLNEEAELASAAPADNDDSNDADDADLDDYDEQEIDDLPIFK